jgi:hypothetical protein
MTHTETNEATDVPPWESVEPGLELFPGCREIYYPTPKQCTACLREVLMTYVPDAPQTIQ